MQRESPLLLRQFAGQLTVHGTSDTHRHELTRLHLVVGGEIDAPVNIGALGVATPHELHGLLVEAITQHLCHSAHTAVVEVVHDPGLYVHHQLRPALGLGGVHTIQHTRRRRPLLRRIREHARPFDADLL